MCGAFVSIWLFVFLRHVVYCWRACLFVRVCVFMGSSLRVAVCLCACLCVVCVAGCLCVGVLVR